MQCHAIPRGCRNEVLNEAQRVPACQRDQNANSNLFRHGFLACNQNPPAAIAWTMEFRRYWKPPKCFRNAFDFWPSERTSNCYDGHKGPRGIRSVNRKVPLADQVSWQDLLGSMRSNGSPFEVLTRRPWRVIKLWIPAAQGLMFNDWQTTREIRRSSVAI